MQIDYQLQKQIYRGDDVCIDFGAQMLRYSKKETTCVFSFYFVHGLNERVKSKLWPKTPSYARLYANCATFESDSFNVSIY